MHLIFPMECIRELICAFHCIRLVQELQEVNHVVPLHLAKVKVDLQFFSFCINCCSSIDVFVSLCYSDQMNQHCQGIVETQVVSRWGVVLRWLQFLYVFLSVGFQIGNEFFFFFFFFKISRKTHDHSLRFLTVD